MPIQKSHRLYAIARAFTFIHLNSKYKFVVVFLCIKYLPQCSFYKRRRGRQIVNDMQLKFMCLIWKQILTLLYTSYGLHCHVARDDELGKRMLHTPKPLFLAFCFIVILWYLPMQKKKFKYYKYKNIFCQNIVRLRNICLV